MCEICGSKGTPTHSISMTSVAGPVTVYVCTEFHQRLNEANKARAASLLKDLAATLDVPQWPKKKK